MSPRAAPSTIVLTIGGPSVCDDIPALCEQVRALLEASTAVLVVYDVGALVHPDAATLDALARLALTARRLGRQVRLQHACSELQELLTLAGLDRILPPFGAASRLGPSGQTEHREQGGGVEERVEADDLPP
jgi:ABC-type transporter Mla MlaB component